MANINLKLTKQQQQYVAAGALGLAAFGYSYIALFWLPISRNIAEVDAKITEVEGKVEKATREASRLPHLQEELTRLNEHAIEAERRLPKKKSTPDILVKVSDLAQDQHVALLSFTPGAQKSQQFFTELSYPISVRGTFHNIGRFLAALALEERIFNVQNVVYGEASGDSGEMSVTFTLLSYQYKG